MFCIIEKCSSEIGQGSVDPVSAYLDAEALVQIALSSGCDCVHPGYGFLSENAHFAELCATQGLTFIGPPVSALDLFGDKVQARTLARSLLSLWYPAVKVHCHRPRQRSTWQTKLAIR